MSTTSVGRGAEDRVAAELCGDGWKIIDRNWRNRWCEIDIVAKKDGCVAFVEVKYRVRPDNGDGFDAVGGAKLARMSRAAEAWVAANNWSGEYELLVASISPEDIEIREIYG